MKRNATKRKPSTKQRRYNWTPDLPDKRDYLFAERNKPLKVIPPKVDLTYKMPHVFDQGQLGSCTANALAGQMGFLHNLDDFSRLFIYYGERSIEGTIRSDSGAQLRDGIKFLAKSGVCEEAMWPYDIKKFAKRPPQPCWDTATQFRIAQYQRLLTLDDMLQCLASGFPFVFGFTVYESFESATVAKTGVLNMPKAGEKALGGHAVEAVGYNQMTKRLTVRNSWGQDWGKNGYFTMPFDYVTDRNLSDDFWTVRA